MLGAIIGDIAGSRFEWNNTHSKNFSFFTQECRPTDDSIMSLAIAQAIINARTDKSELARQAVVSMRQLGARYPDIGYGKNFSRWLKASDPKPYNSYGNGAAMRVSACAWAARSLEEAKYMSQKVTEITHNHPEGLKGAQATVSAIFAARQGKTLEEIRSLICENYYPIDFTLDEIRPTYHYEVSCQKSVPQAMEAFFESKNFEDAIRNAISIGGDSDTIAAITGGIAQAYWGIPHAMRQKALTFLDEDLRKILTTFESYYPPHSVAAKNANTAGV